MKFSLTTFVIVLFTVLVHARNAYAIPPGVGAPCARIHDCARGLQCIEKRCSIPPALQEMTECHSGLDCIIVHQKLGFDCCGPVCDASDYSQPEWIPVNRDWYEKQLRAKCLNQRHAACAAPRSCENPPRDRRFTVECQGGNCAKVKFGAQMDRF